MPKSGRKKRVLPSVSVASIYNEDIGFEGLKKKRISSTDGLSFHMPIDEQEEQKRRKRMVRYRSAGSVTFPNMNGHLPVPDFESATVFRAQPEAIVAEEVNK